MVDASLAVTATLTRGGFAFFADEELVAPPLMWSEGRSGLHEAVWRGELAADEGRAAQRRLENAPVRTISDPGLGEECWRIADDLGWAKTYDAEYIALAALLNCRLVTVDARLRRGAGRLGFVVTPTEL